MKYLRELLKVCLGTRRKAQLVKFKNGNYGIRYTTVCGYRFHDFYGDYKWSCSSRWFETSCQTSREHAQQVYEKITQPIKLMKHDIGEVVVDDLI